MKTGDCYRAAVEFLLANRDVPEMQLVHGEVTGQGALTGVRFDHAWVEIGDIVIDKSNGRSICMQREDYHALGEIGNVRRYGYFQTLRKLVESPRRYPRRLADRGCHSFV